MRLHKTVQQNRISGIDAGISAFMLHQRASRHSNYTIKHYSNSLRNFVIRDFVQFLKSLNSLPRLKVATRHRRPVDQTKPESSHPWLHFSISRCSLGSPSFGESCLISFV